MTSSSFALDSPDVGVDEEEIIALAAAPSRQEVLIHFGAARAAIDFRPLLPGLDFLDHYLATLRDHRLAVERPALAEALGEADTLRSHLRELALTVHPGIRATTRSSCGPGSRQAEGSAGAVPVTSRFEP